MSILLRAACTGLAALVVIVALVAIPVALAGRMTSVTNGSQIFAIAQLGRPARLVLGPSVRRHRRCDPQGSVSPPAPDG